MKKPTFRELERQKREYYNEQFQAAKERFLEKTGKKIARGFSDTKEYKRILKNQKQAFRRLEKKKIQDFVSGKKKRLKGGRVTGKEIRTTGRNKFFWEMLTGMSEVITEWREAEQAGMKTPGVDLFGVVIDYNGNRQVYTSEFYFTRALSELARDAAKLQRRVTITTVNAQGKKEKTQKTLYYPQVELSIIEDSNGAVYIVVRGIPENEATQSN